MRGPVGSRTSGCRKASATAGSHSDPADDRYPPGRPMARAWSFASNRSGAYDLYEKPADVRGTSASSEMADSSVPTPGLAMAAFILYWAGRTTAT